ncbi:MAG: proline dehydrogenase family protein [Ignavibacteria bacterium]|nr:proline dehydrogenase family protein [Ignavibacteria bacterium]
MMMGRNILLWASKNEWMTGHIPNYTFVQKAVKRFMPGETPSDAFHATRNLLKLKIPTTLTHLGENINNLAEAEKAAEHYYNLLEQIYQEQLDIEISLKLTQIGFDLSIDKTFDLFKQISQKAKECDNNVFIDIEDNSYVDNTIMFYKKMKLNYDNVGLCLQAYLYRTMDDIKKMMDIDPCIRLVKGAYNEPEIVAFKHKAEVDDNFFKLSKYFLEQIERRKIRVAFATHDIVLQQKIKDVAQKIEIPNEKVEFQMLYGIKNREQTKLAEEGYKIRTLISYGKEWYPWYMRRLAERPANVGFLLRNIFSK